MSDCTGTRYFCMRLNRKPADTWESSSLMMPDTIWCTCLSLLLDYRCLYSLHQQNAVELHLCYCIWIFPFFLHEESRATPSHFAFFILVATPPALLLLACLAFLLASLLDLLYKCCDAWAVSVRCMSLHLGCCQLYCGNRCILWAVISHIHTFVPVDLGTR